MASAVIDKKALEAAQSSVLDVTRRLYDRGLNSTLSGNVSARVEGHPNFMVITPSALDKVRITPDQLSVVEISTETLMEGRPKQSSEYQVHTHIYRAKPAVMAVVHPHPPYSLAIVAAFGAGVIDELAANAEEFDYYVGGVGVVKGKAGTKELADLVAAEITKGNRTVIMEEHGTVGTGRTMQEALSGVEALEHMAMKLAIEKTLRASKQ